MIDYESLLKDINQLLLDINNTVNSKEKEILKTYIQLKIKYLLGLVKNL